MVKASSLTFNLKPLKESIDEVRLMAAFDNVNVFGAAAAQRCSFTPGDGVTQFIRLIKSPQVPIVSRDEQSRTVQRRALETGN